MRPLTIKILILGIVFLGPITANATNVLNPTEDDYPLKLLGKFVFFDNISQPSVMSCATCHDPDTGGTGRSSLINETQVAINGADPDTVGFFRPTTNTYATLIPAFHDCGIGGVRVAGIGYCGGNFWNGRAEGTPSLLPGSTPHVNNEVFVKSNGGTNNKLKTRYQKYIGPATDQALNPFANDDEQNVPVSPHDKGLPGAKFVCQHVAKSVYAILYTLAWEEPINCSDRVDISFKRIAMAVGAYQSSSDINSFSSKRDKALRAELACLQDTPDAKAKVCNHPNFTNSPGNFPLVGLTDEENLGHDLFYNEQFPPFGPPPPRLDLPVTNCSFCHLSDADTPDGTALNELYTDHAYHNIGTPVNPELPHGPQSILGVHANNAAASGGVKTPTMRNVDKRPYKTFIKAYAHNGWFKSLESLVHFYNTAFMGGFSIRSGLVPYENTTAAQFGITRCEHSPITEQEAVAQNCWPEPEWGDTVSISDLVGNIGMNLQQEAALVAYLKTLNDDHTAEPPQPYEILVAIFKYIIENK